MKSLIVAKREYTKVVRKRSFWIATLFFPLFVLGIGFISGLSGQDIDNNIEQAQSELKSVIIKDDSGLINKDLVQQLGYKLSTDLESNIDKVKSGEISGFIYYPKDLIASKTVKVYGKDLGIVMNNVFTNISNDLIKNSALANIQSPDLLIAYGSTFETETDIYNNGEVISNNPERFIVPIIAVVIYFVLTAFATSYLLMSVSEEKENRAIEIILSAIKPKDLIVGKIFGQVGVVVTQVLILLLFSIIGLFFIKDSIPFEINLSSIEISPIQIISAIFYSLLSFFILAATMVGVGAAMPNYKEANSFSAVFIFLAISPIYFIGAIISNPSGEIATILSYVPFANGVTLLFRSTFDVLSPLEMILSSAVLIIYSILSVIIAFKLFEFGALEYSRKITFKDLLSTLRKN